MDEIVVIYPPLGDRKGRIKQDLFPPAPLFWPVSTDLKWRKR